MIFRPSPSTSVVITRSQPLSWFKVPTTVSLEATPLSPGVETVWIWGSERVLDVYKDDPDAFIFSLSNPYHLPVSRYKKRKGSTQAIYCHPKCGPVFGFYDIFICDHCNKPQSCYIKNNGENGYESHPTFKKSLFVRTSTPDKQNYFGVLEYEVYTYK